jgi:hypothetical protein
VQCNVFDLHARRFDSHRREIASAAKHWSAISAERSPRTRGQLSTCGWRWTHRMSRGSRYAAAHRTRRRRIGPDAAAAFEAGADARRDAGIPCVAAEAPLSISAGICA